MLINGENPFPEDILTQRTDVEDLNVANRVGLVTVHLFVYTQVSSQIARLASQYHVSEYSCLKYGPKGYPGQYVPLSLQQPEMFKELRTRQAQWWSNTKAWWYSQKEKTTAEPAVTLGPSGSLSDGLAQQLSAAMDEQLPQTLAEERLPRSVSTTIKTSSSHPIK